MPNPQITKNCLSKIFQPTTKIPKNATLVNSDVTSKSQRLMLELGLIQQANTGCYHLLPLCIRSLEKLTKFIDTEMNKINAQKMCFPYLINENLWHKSGRLTSAINSELFQLKDRHQHEYILSPTHEESAADLLTSLGQQSYKQYPLLIYQITNKFRDEMKPRFGLIRAKQFLMKDLYSFDVDLKNAKQTYELICATYDKIFSKIGIKFIKVEGNVGIMGGNLSHEYHFPAKIGEDTLFSCKNCNYHGNDEICNEKCPICGSNGFIQTGIEVGHTFLLGEKYSKPLNTKYINRNNKPESLQMGSYGLGLTRILAGSLEILSLEQELRWPKLLAPFHIVILPPKSGSKEENLITTNLTESLYEKLNKLCDELKDNILIDDRITLTIGKRYLDAKRMGYNYILVLGKRAPLIELNNLETNEQLYLNETDLLSYISKKYK